MSKKYSIWATGMTEPARFEVLDGEFEIIYNGEKYHKASSYHHMIGKVKTQEPLAIGDFVKVTQLESADHFASIGIGVDSGLHEADIIGLHGKIIDRGPAYPNLYCVEFAKSIPNLFHSADGKSKPGHAYYFARDQLEKVL